MEGAAGTTSVLVALMQEHRRSQRHCGMTMLQVINSRLGENLRRLGDLTARILDVSGQFIILTCRSTGNPSDDAGGNLRRLGDFPTEIVDVS